MVAGQLQYTEEDQQKFYHKVSKLWFLFWLSHSVFCYSKFVTQSLLMPGKKRKNEAQAETPAKKEQKVEEKEDPAARADLLSLCTSFIEVLACYDHTAEMYGITMPLDRPSATIGDLKTIKIQLATIAATLKKVHGRFSDFPSSPSLAKKTFTTFSPFPINQNPKTFTTFSPFPTPKTFTAFSSLPIKQAQKTFTTFFGAKIHCGLSLRSDVIQLADQSALLALAQPLASPAPAQQPKEVVASPFATSPCVKGEPNSEFGTIAGRGMKRFLLTLGVSFSAYISDAKEPQRLESCFQGLNPANEQAIRAGEQVSGMPSPTSKEDALLNAAAFLNFLREAGAETSLTQAAESALSLGRSVLDSPDQAQAAQPGDLHSASGLSQRPSPYCPLKGRWSRSPKGSACGTQWLPFRVSAPLRRSLLPPPLLPWHTDMPLRFLPPHLPRCHMDILLPLPRRTVRLHITNALPGTQLSLTLCLTLFCHPSGRKPKNPFMGGMMKESFVLNDKFKDTYVPRFFSTPMLCHTRLFFRAPQQCRILRWMELRL
jgi:hypothetical protein